MIVRILGAVRASALLLTMAIVVGCSNEPAPLPLLEGRWHSEALRKFYGADMSPCRDGVLRFSKTNIYVEGRWWSRPPMHLEIMAASVRDGIVVLELRGTRMGPTQYTAYLEPRGPLLRVVNVEHSEAYQRLVEMEGQSSFSSSIFEAMRQDRETSIRTLLLLQRCE